MNELTIIAFLFGFSLGGLCGVTLALGAVQQRFSGYQPRAGDASIGKPPTTE